MISRAAAAAPRVSHAARRQGRLSHGAAATVTAAAAASRAGPGNAALASQRAVPGGGRYRVRVLIPGQVQDPCHRAAGRGGAGGQAGQQAEPAVPQDRGRDPGGRDDEGYLQYRGEQVSGRVRSGPGHGRRAGTEQPARGGRDCCERPGQHQGADDEADDVARMTVTRGRQQLSRILRARCRCTDRRLIGGRQLGCPLGRIGRTVLVHVRFHPLPAWSGGAAVARPGVP